ncbi:MAG: hypothetical protein KDK24_09505 [Pseudooceanicola sp.]|nr:hypothetical protein [Pseudooceanicola sp.]
MSKDAIKALRSDIAEARKRPVNFGVCMGKKPDATVLMTHKSKNAESLAREAKKQGETVKTACGVLEIDGTKMNFTCTDEPPTGFAKSLKGFLKSAGLTSLKVRILSTDGALLEDDGDPDEEEVVAEDPGYAEEPEAEEEPVQDVTDEAPLEEELQPEAERAPEAPSGGGSGYGAPEVEAEREPATAEEPSPPEVEEPAQPEPEPAEAPEAEEEHAPEPAVAASGPGDGAGGAAHPAGNTSGAAAVDAPSAAPSKKATDLSGDDAAKLERIGKELTAVGKLVDAYMAVIPGSAEPKPADWTKVVSEQKDYADQMKAADAVLETAKLDKALKALADLVNEINAKTVEKKDWKRALDALNARLKTLDNHPQAAQPEIQPKIDAIKAKRDAAVAKADKQDFKGAIKAVEPLMAECDKVEVQADDCAHYKAIRTSRDNLVAGTIGNPATGVASIDKMQADCQALLDKATAEAAADKFKEAVKTLDEVPPLHTRMLQLQEKKTDYDTRHGNITLCIADIDALPAADRALMEPELARFRKDFADAQVAKTGDYNLSCNMLIHLDIADRPYLVGLTRALELYTPSKTDFEAALTRLKAHAGKAGIAAFIQKMEDDKVRAEAEAGLKHYPAATAIYDRTFLEVADQEQKAQDYVDYTAKLAAVTPLVDAERGRAGGESGVAQADALIATAAKQALELEYAAGLATLNEAEKRAAEAKTSADAVQALDGLKDTAALDGMATDFDKAYKVYTDMKAAVDSADSTGTFRAHIAEADTPAGAAKTAAAGGDFATARTQLDAAIAHLEAVLPKVTAWGPYQNRRSAVRLELNLNLPGKNPDNSIQPHIDEATALLTSADGKAADPAWDIAGADADITKAKIITDQANADAALYVDVRRDLGDITGIKTKLGQATHAPVVAYMATRVARIDKYLTDIPASVANRKMKEAASEAAEGAALKTPTDDELADGATALKNKVDNYDTLLPDVDGKAACVKQVDAAKEKLKIYEADLAKPNFIAAVWSSWPPFRDLEAAKRVLDATVAYEPLKIEAWAKLNLVKLVRNPGVEEELTALEARYDAAPALVEATNFHRATIEMNEIIAACPPLAAKAQAFQPYEDARVTAKAKMDEAAAHPQASAIQPMIQRLTAKYALGESSAAEGRYPAAQTLMEEIETDAQSAIESADSHAGMELVTGLLDGAADTGILPEAVILATQALLDRLSARPEAVGANVELATAATQLAFAKAGSGATKQALKDAIAACNAADEKMSQYRMLEQSVTRANAQVAALRAHAQAAYVEPLLAPVDSQLGQVLTTAVASGDHMAQATVLDGLVAQLDGFGTLAEDYDKYLSVRAEAAVEPMVATLEAHPHRYAIKPSIDTMRSKLEEAARLAGDHKATEALDVLEEVRRIGAAAHMLAEMRGNIAPTPEAVKALLAQPGGEAELDAMMGQLEPDAQRDVLRVAFEARYGCKLEIYTYNAVTDVQTLDIIDGGKIGPNIQRFYEYMSKLPPGDTTGNDSLLIWSDRETGGSWYDSDRKEVGMNEGRDETSGHYGFGREFEVGGQDEECKPVDNEPVTWFSWNTLHEVGHAVDDKNNYMGSNGGSPDHGGWISYGRDYGKVAKVFAKHFEYDQTYIEQAMLEAANIARPEPPAGVEPEEWERRRIAASGHVALCLESTNPWTSNSQASRITIDGRVYQESYPGNWTSYLFAARQQGMTGYQFRAPGEWFSELYAAYHIGKMKPGHPAAGWLAGLAGPDA